VARVEQLSFRDGTAADLAATFAISERTMKEIAERQGIVPPGRDLTDADIRAEWMRQRSLIEFLAAQPDGRFVICEEDDRPIGYARVVRFGRMEQLTELMVEPERQGHGVGRALLERCWPEDPTAELGRVVVAAGAPLDLSLYTAFNVMPVTGHWHMRQTATGYREQRSHEDSTEPGVHVMKPDRAVEEWQRLEPEALGHERKQLHEFFGRDRTCLAYSDQQTGEAVGLCWVSSDGDIGPAVARRPGDLAPVVLAALDRVALTQEPEHLSVFCTTTSWWLLHRLRSLGFRVFWPSWVMCTEPLPGLDRYVPTRPAQIL
jgi:GNAT superfamily N-acetyltransferase